MEGNGIGWKGWSDVELVGGNGIGWREMEWGGVGWSVEGVLCGLKLSVVEYG